MTSDIDAVPSEAFEEWASEEGINNFHFNHCWDAWQAALLSASKPAAHQTLSDGAQYFACYLIDNCENEVVREESVQAWLGKMLASPRYHPATPPQSPDGRTIDRAMVKRLAVQYGLIDAAPAKSGEPVAWMVLASNTRKPCEVTLHKSETEALRQDCVIPLCAAPQPAQAAVVLDDERAAFQSIIDAGRSAKPKHMGGIGENTVYLTPEMYVALGQAPISAFESALAELVNKIDTGLDSGDLLADAQRASSAIDSILSGGDLVASAHEYFRDSGDRYEKSVEFRIGWNACLDAIGAARAASTQATATTREPEDSFIVFRNEIAAICRDAGCPGNIGMTAWLKERLSSPQATALQPPALTAQSGGAVPSLWEAFEMGFSLRGAMLGHVLDGRDVGRLTTCEFWHPSMLGMHEGTDLHVGLSVNEAIVKVKNEVRRRLDAFDAARQAAPQPVAQTERALTFAPLYKKLMRGDVDICEAYLRLKVVGSCPTQEEFCAALDALLANGDANG